MTFRPSDDVLEELADSQNSQSWTYNNGYDNAYDEASNQWIWQQNFSDWWIDNYESVWEAWTSPIVDLPVEEVKAPDLSEILKQQGENWLEGEDLKSSNVINNVSWNNDMTKVSNDKNEEKDYKIEIQRDEPKNSDIQEIKSIQNWENNEQIQWDVWSAGWPLNFLMDEQWIDAVKKYKVLHRILFKWGLFICVAIVWVCLWMLLYTNFASFTVSKLVREDSILDKTKWNDYTVDKVVYDYEGSWWNFEVIIPFGSVSIDWENIQSKSNLILYKWVVLPQLMAMNKDVDDFISLSDFGKGVSSRKDLESLLEYMITDDWIWTKTKELTNPYDSLRVWNKFNQKSFIDWFSLWCLEKRKVSNYLCDSFVSTFYKYGKYYDLWYYADNVLLIMRELKKQGKDVEPICKMVIDYTQHSWNISSDALFYVMEYCNVEDFDYYKKLTSFIKIDNSLWQPELSAEVFEDPDLNAYKLLSAQQVLNKKLALKTVSEGYIKSYLNYVQALINKDNGTNRYLAPIYKDILYIFNMDILYKYLIENSFVNLRLQVDQINNGNVVYGYPALLSQLTTSDIVKQNEDNTSIELENLEIEDIFEQYYYMTDRLKIRKVTKISENELKVQTELFTNKILSATDGATLKLTVSLYKNGNVLYVSNIKVANQIKLSEILNIYAKDGVTFYAMLNYIDDQIGMWYELPSEELDQQKSLCDELQEIEDIVIYSCEDTSILLYKGDIEYNFVLVNGVLDSFVIGDEELDNLVHDMLWSTMFMAENTPTAIKSIIRFEKAESWDNSISEKLDIIDQFRIHFKVVPDDVINIEWKDSEFIVKFTLWEFKLQANYDIGTHLLTKISYVACDKTLEIRNLTIEVSTDNESKLIEILNNPRVFFAQANPAAYKKYQRMCNEDKPEENKK